MNKSFWNKLALIFVSIFMVSLLSSCAVPGTATTTEAPVTDAPETDEPTKSPPITDNAYQLNEGSPLFTLPYYNYDSYFAYWDMENGA